MAERVGQCFGNYQLLRLLGRGAFAEVYLGEHRYLEIPAAIKVLHVRMGPETHEQFRREARTIAHLQHPHIIRVLDFGFQDQTPFLVMEYLPHGTLRTRHPKGTRLPLEQIVTYVKQIAPALDYAHQQRVIHRDIKPENMLLSAQHEVVLSDFGIAVVQPTMESLSTQNPAGTPLYMAPEQIRGKPCAASDQYALAVVVYEWLCGEPPFRGSLFEVYRQHLDHPPPGLCRRVPQLPPVVEDAVLGALAKDPQQRFTSVQDFATVLEAACFATQPLDSRVLPERESQDQYAPPITLSALMAAPRAGEEDLSAETTQPRPMASQQRGDEQERVRLVTPLPVVASPTVSKQAKPSVAQRNRERLLRKVRAFWITGVLEHSVHGAALIALGLQEQPDALAHPWQLVLQKPAGASHPLPEGTRITQVYDAANGELLILGAPGSGKTTLLLELARDLLERAEHDEQHPLPVVFNLSSWALKQQRLTDWLAEELHSSYQVPRPLAQAWVDADQILPLLDGLDEVAPKERTRCIETINTYRQEHGLLPLVVCSRSADYLAQTARVRLGSAVAVQPLTGQQVDDYLARGRELLRALRVALHQDAVLRELTSTPLMLSILTLTYQGVSVEELSREASLTDRQRQIFEHYIERMLSHRKAESRYPQEQTTHWLSWLARQMKQQGQTVFYIEHLQPDWLSDTRMLGVYDWLAVRLPGMLMGGLVSLTIAVFFSSSLSYAFLITSILLGGLLGGLLSEGSIPQRSAVSGGEVGSALRPRLLQRLLIGMLIGLSSGLIFGLSAGLIFGLSTGLGFGLGSILLQFLLGKNHMTEARSPTLPPAKGTIWQRLFRRKEIHNGLLVGLIFGLSFGLSDGLSEGLSDGLASGLATGLIFGLITGLLSVLLVGRSTVVQPTDLLVWSWKSLGKSLFSKSHASMTARVTALIGLIYGLSQGLLFGPSNGLIYGLSYGLSNGLSLGLSYWLLLGLFQGVSSATIEDQRRVVPNQGIRRSALNGLVLGLISTAIVGLLYWLGFGLAGWLSNGLIWSSFELSFGLLGGLFELSFGLLGGLSAGLLVGLLNGGLAFFRHYVLRFLLWRAGSIPWNYPRFLDFAAERILLRKVGGGYIFVHRLLLEYFAALDRTSTLDEARTQTQQAQSVS